MSGRTPNECYVYFGLFGLFNPKQLTKRIGITPTSSALQGSKDPERGIPVTSIWKFSSQRIVSEAIDVYELAEEVVAQLEPHSQEIRNAISDLDLTGKLQVVMHFSTHDDVPTPAIGFSNRIIAFLSKVNASIDVDTYILP